MALIVLLGCAALTVDVGVVTVRRGRLQAVCDAAALAGAGSLPTVAAAQAAAATYYAVNATDSTTPPAGVGTYQIGNDTVVVTTPYSDAYTDAMGWSPANLVKVSTSSPTPLTFSRALGLNATNVTASAVAFRCGSGRGPWGEGDAVMFAKDLGYQLNCNVMNVKGSICANSDMTINLNNVWVGNTLHAKGAMKLSGNNFNGHFTAEYGTTYKVSANHTDIAAVVQVPQVDLEPPINYDPANYATDFHVTQSFPSSVTITGSTVITAPGTYFINGNLNINANNTNLSHSTFIVTGSVNINTDNLTLGYNENYMTFFVTGGGTIGLNMNNLTVEGDLYAPNGYISCNSNNIHKGWWVARRISINCNTFELDGLPGRDGGKSLMLVE